MTTLEEIPDMVKEYWDLRRPGWRDPFENPPCFASNIVRVVDKTDTVSRLLYLDCGHEKTVNMMVVKRNAKSFYEEGAQVICDVCRNAYNPRIERLTHVECAPAT